MRTVEDFDGDDLATGGIHSDRAGAGVKIERAATLRPAPVRGETRDGVEARAPGIAAAAQLNDGEGRNRARQLGLAAGGEERDEFGGELAGQV